MKSSDSTKTVPSLAMDPKKLRRKVAKAITPVLLSLKLVMICGILPKMSMRKGQKLYNLLTKNSIRARYDLPLTIADHSWRKESKTICCEKQKEADFLCGF
jgi:hypothetical protein